MKKLQKFYLGVEGGATKSAALLVNERDEVVMERRGKALNYHSGGEQQVRKNLLNLLSPILRKTKVGKVYAVLGLAGIDTRKDEIFHRKLVRSLLPKNSTFRVVNDAESGIEAKCPGEKHRILVIAGTGSSVYGESNRKTAKSVGWEFILGDEGSGYDVGLKIIKAAVQSWDGRSDKTLLEKSVLQHTNSRAMEDFIDKVDKVMRDERQSIKYFVASFGPLLNEALQKDDWEALRIRKEVVEELTKGVIAVVHRLHLADQEFCIGLVGSVWKMPGLKENFQDAIKRQFPHAQFSQRTEGGEWGAVRLAKQLAPH